MVYNWSDAKYYCLGLVMGEEFFNSLKLSLKLIDHFCDFKSVKFRKKRRTKSSDVSKGTNDKSLFNKNPEKAIGCARFAGYYKLQK